MKKNIFFGFVFFCVALGSLFSQTFKIEKVDYEISGQTLE